MKVAVYSLTRDRFELTRECFERLWELGYIQGTELHHFVVDNGSRDGSLEWLADRHEEGEVAGLQCNPTNLGISRGEQVALAMIRAEQKRSEEPFAVVVKFDNDCFIDPYVVGLAVKAVATAGQLGQSWVLSPEVKGLDRPPKWSSTVRVAGWEIGEVGHVGGICRCSPGALALGYDPNLELPQAWGQDEDFSRYARDAGARLGYIEGLFVHHHLTTAGQAERYPEYFRRKAEEEGSRNPALLRGRRKP